MRKNFQVHLYLETELLEKLKKQAIENKTTVSDICRQKLKENTQLTRIEFILEEVKRILITKFKQEV